MPAPLIKNAAPLDLVTTAPAATATPAAAHYYEMDMKRKVITIIAEDKTGYNVAIDRGEIEVFGYLTIGDEPGLVGRIVVNSATGRQQIPLTLESPNVFCLYIRQGTQDAAVGAAAAQNPAMKYQLVLDK